MLISARLWFPRQGCAAQVRSDSLSGMRAVVQMVSSSPDLNAIAREIALDAHRGSYEIDLAVHIPGIANKLPDELSRAWAPEAKPFPPELRGVQQVEAPPRDAEFWTTWVSSGRGAYRRR